MIYRRKIEVPRAARAVGAKTWSNFAHAKSLRVWYHLWVGMMPYYTKPGIANITPNNKCLREGERWVTRGKEWNHIGKKTWCSCVIIAVVSHCTFWAAWHYLYTWPHMSPWCTTAQVCASVQIAVRHSHFSEGIRKHDRPFMDYGTN